MIAPKIMPRAISMAVRAAVAPVVFMLNVQAAYLDAWHAVFREVRK